MANLGPSFWLDEERRPKDVGAAARGLCLKCVSVIRRSRSKTKTQVGVGPWSEGSCTRRGRKPEDECIVRWRAANMVTVLVFGVGFSVSKVYERSEEIISYREEHGYFQGGELVTLLSSARRRVVSLACLERLWT